MSQGCVLIVDDEPINLVLLESLLEDHYQVQSASSADEALTLCQSSSSQIDVILSDVLMPGMTGYQLCQELKSHAATRNIPVLLVSSLDAEQDQVAGLKAGAADLINKPYSPELLLARVRTQMRLRKLSQTLQAHGIAEPQ
jgi:putative two-component system response regulator